MYSTAPSKLSQSWMNQIAMNFQPEWELTKEMELAIPSLLQALIRQQPDAIAIQGLIGLPLSYQYLWKQVWATVVALNHLGIGPHDRVAVALPNGPEDRKSTRLNSSHRT